MGQPVVHFEVLGKDEQALRRYYGELFGWEFSEPLGPTNYTVTTRDQNVNSEGVGIGGGVGGVPDGYDGHVTFYVEVDDVDASLAKAEELGGARMMGPVDMENVGIRLAQFTDIEGHVIGLVSNL
jgi:uncharacterized protein